MFEKEGKYLSICIYNKHQLFGINFLKHTYIRLTKFH